MHTYMKNFFQKFAAVALVLAAMAGWSCEECDHVPYDDTELKEQIADLYSRVEALEARLQAEVTTLTNMISGQVTIKSHVKDENGNWTITLTDGTSFVVYAEYKPEELPTNLIYVMEVEGEKVWAVKGENGKLTPIQDAEGNNIPVVPAEIEFPAPPTIQTQIVDGVIQISIDGGKTWHNTGVDPESLPEEDDTPIEGGACTGAACANIVDVVVNTMEDQYGDEMPISATFTLADGSSFTVMLDGTYGFAFQYWGEQVDSFFLAPGASTSDLNLWQNLLVDFIKEVPQGWKVEFAEPDRYGEIVIKLAAPSAEALASGAAVSEGVIKLIGVFEGGKTAIAKLKVTTEPFANVSASAGQVTVEPNQGVEQFVYGITPAASYSEESVKSALEGYLANGLWSGWNPPYNVSSYYQVINASAAEVYGSELTPGVKYVLWAATVKEEQSGWDYIYSLSSEFYTATFSQMLVEVEATKITFNDIQVKINFLGFDRYFGGITQKSYFDGASQISYINGAYEMGFESSLTTYANDAPTAQASLTQFPCADIPGIQPSMTYVMWIMPVEEGKTVYSMEDMKVFEFTSAALQSGGTLKVTAKTEPEITFSSISLFLQAETGASAAYYKYYETATMPADSELVMDVLNTGTMVSAEIPAAAYDLESDTEYTLVAIAVDNDGKYGELCKFTYKTQGVTFSETFTLAVTKEEIASPFDAATKAKFKPVTAGGTATIYYYANLTAAEVASWASDDAIAKELVLNETYMLRKQVRPSALDADGCFTVQNLTTDTEYTLYILATDGENYTKLQKVTYTPTLNAKIVAATDAAWATSKPTVTVNSVVKSGYSYKVNYTVTPAAGTSVDGGHFMNVYTNGKDTAGLLAYMMTASTAYRYISGLTESATYEKSFNVTSASIFVTWTDAEGNYYEPLKVVVEAPAE